MNMFEQDRAGKLKRILPLRIMNAIGMIAWREDRYGCAQQKLRMLHPLSWPWVLLMLIAGIFLHGLIEIVKESKNLRDEMVWW